MSMVRRSADFVMNHAQHVQINNEKLNTFASCLSEPQEWDTFSYHYKGEKILDYIFAIDAINFCFWPVPSFEYENLASNLQSMLERSPEALSPSTISSISESTVQEEILEGQNLETEERTRLLRELGERTVNFFEGSYQTLLERAENSAEKLIDLMAQYYPGFRDAAIYRGRQVFFYKRAQILIGDLHGSKAWGFNDISSLTMFPDYRVPQLLHTEGVLVYSPELETAVMNLQEIPAGSAYEIEIRAATVQACEKISERLQKIPIEADWLLWQRGEELKDELHPHHRTRTIFY